MRDWSLAILGALEPVVSEMAGGGLATFAHNRDTQAAGRSAETTASTNETVSISPEPTSAPKGEIVAISRERHRDALAQALDSLAAARYSVLAAMPPEIVAVDVMAAADALGSITGIVGTEDVLDALFREFCVGK